MQFFYVMFLVLMEFSLKNKKYENCSEVWDVVWYDNANKIRK